MRRVVPWVSAAVVVVLLFGAQFLLLVRLQEAHMRYPQLQMAQDAADALNKGAQKLTVTQGRVDMAVSQAAFVNVYDQEGGLVAGEGLLDGQVPLPPLSMLQKSAKVPFATALWQPKQSVRIAAVIVASEKYFVLSGRSIAYANHTLRNSAAVTAGCALLALLTILAVYFSTNKKIAGTAIFATQQPQSTQSSNSSTHLPANPPLRSAPTVSTPSRPASIPVTLPQKPRPKPKRPIIQ